MSIKKITAISTIATMATIAAGSASAQEVPNINVNVDNASTSLSVGGGGGGGNTGSKGMQVQGVLNSVSAPSGYPSNSAVMPVSGCNGDLVSPVTNKGSYGIWFLSFSTGGKITPQEEGLYRAMLCEVYAGRGSQYLNLVRKDPLKKQLLAALMYEYLYQETSFLEGKSEAEISEIEKIFDNPSVELQDMVIKSYHTYRRMAVQERRAELLGNNKSNNSKSAEKQQSVSNVTHPMVQQQPVVIQPVETPVSQKQVENGENNGDGLKKTLILGGKVFFRNQNSGSYFISGEFGTSYSITKNGDKYSVVKNT